MHTRHQDAIGKKNNMEETPYNSLERYLTNREQYIHLTIHNSYQIHTECGVTQGSILVLLLCCIHIHYIGIVLYTLKYLIVFIYP